MIIIAGSGMVTGGRILAWMRAIPDVRRVALHHGDVEAQEAFATWAPEQLAPV